MGKLIDNIELLDEPIKSQLGKLLENFSPELEQTVILKNCPPDHALLRVQDSADMIYLLLRGRIRGVNEQVNGTMYAFARFNAPYFFGEFEAFAGCKLYRSTLICETACKLALIPRHTYLAWVRADSEALFKRTCQITRALMQQARSERNYLFYSGTERLMTWLTAQYSRKNQAGVCRLHVTHQEIADNIGLCTKTVQRNLSNLRKQGLVEKQGRTLFFDKKQYQRLLDLCLPKMDETIEFETFIDGEE